MARSRDINGERSVHEEDPRNARSCERLKFDASTGSTGYFGERALKNSEEWKERVEHVTRDVSRRFRTAMRWRECFLQFHPLG